MTRPIAGDRLLVPGEVAVVGDALRWTHSRKHPARSEPVPTDLLEQFARLHLAKDDSIASFSGHFGILGICRHGLPRTHNLQRLMPSDGEITFEQDDELECAPMNLEIGDTQWGGVEPIAPWRHWSREADDILMVATAIHMGRAPDKNVLSRLGKRPGESAGLTVARAVQTWLELGGVRPQLSWAGDKFTMALATRSTWEQIPMRPSLRWAHAHGTNLFGALAVQATALVAQKEGFAFCSNCGRTYLPARRPAAGRRNYCSGCRSDGAHLRDAQRDSRARRKASV